jgi:hypothetical protein
LRYAVEEVRRSTMTMAMPIIVSAPRAHFGEHPGG